MMPPRDATTVSPLLWGAALLLVLGMGLGARLADPLSSPVIAAEDPYTHMALVREHLRDGSMDPLNVPGTLYPPGMHAFLATAWVYTGMDLYDMVRFGAVAFGVLGILGVALLVLRTAGPVAALVGALAVALAPEAVFRTTMTAPTALDLALLPFFFLALIEIVRGRLVWLGAAVPLAVFLAFSHPWLFAVLALAGAVFCGLALVYPWPSRDGLATVRGLAAAASLIGVGLAMAMTGCWSACGPGFRDVLGPERAAVFSLLGNFVFAAAISLGTIVALSPERLERLSGWIGCARPDPLMTVGASAIFLVVVTVPALRIGMPEGVDLRAMFGWPLLLAGIAGLLALPYVWGPAAHLGAALFFGTYPFVVYDPFASPFWSHRTAVYLGLALVILAAVALGTAMRAAARAIAGIAWTRAVATRPFLALAPVSVLALSFGGAWAAATPGVQGGGWYRLYEPCELDALEAIAEEADARPDLLVVASGWRAKLVLAALSTDASRIWYKADMFTNEKARAGFLTYIDSAKRPLLVVVDRYLPTDHRTAETGFLSEPPWTPMLLSACAGAPATVAAYTYSTVSR